MTKWGFSLHRIIKKSMPWGGRFCEVSPFWDETSISGRADGCAVCVFSRSRRWYLYIYIIYYGWFVHKLGISWSQLTNSIIFQRGRLKPPTSICIYNHIYIYIHAYIYIGQQMSNKRETIPVIHSDDQRWQAVVSSAVGTATVALVAAKTYWCVLRREWMGCWRLLGWNW